MKRLILAAAAVVVLTGAASAATVRLGTEGAYAPWNFLDDSGKVAGFEIDLGNELCRRATLECEWVVNEWDTIIPNLIAGNYDAIMAGMSITDERKQSIDFSENYFPPDPSKYMTTAGRSFDFDKLQGVRIGVQGATIQAAYAEQNLAAGNTILSFETADQALADLNAGNVDVILADGSYLAEVVTGSAGALTFVGPDVIIGGGVGIGLRKADDELENTFNAAIGEMKKDGSLDALITKWFPEKGTGPFFD
ncbi:transporter substrate-binding domain-containing protein [Devosia sp.]|uniref:transporter substrate-binding domain-containing protein n=1 Tax=Devosia sp. TaxID=1871048 RepID=UPI002F2153C9